MPSISGKVKKQWTYNTMIAGGPGTCHMSRVLVMTAGCHTLQVLPARYAPVHRTLRDRQLSQVLLFFKLKPELGVIRVGLCRAVI